MTLRVVEGGVQIKGSVSGTDSTTIGLHPTRNAQRVYLENPAFVLATGVATFEGAGTVSVLIDGSLVTISGEEEVSSLNSQTGNIVIGGAGEVSVVTLGNTITISGTPHPADSPNDPDIDSINTVTGTLTLGGADGVNIVDDTTNSDTPVLTVSGFRTEFVTTSGFLQTQIDAVEGSDVDSINSQTGAITIQGAGEVAISTAGGVITVSGTPHTPPSVPNDPDIDSINTVTGTLTLQGVDGISVIDDTIISDTPILTVSGFYDEFVAASGTLNSTIDSDIATHAADSSAHHPRYTKQENDAITGSDGITVVSGSNTIDVGGFRSEFVAASGSLQSQIDTFDFDEVEPAIIGVDGITVISGSSTTTVSGFRNEFLNASGTLQGSIDQNTAAIAQNTTLITTTSGHLQGQIDSIDVDEVEPAIVGEDGITVISGSNNTTVSGFRTEFVAASGSLQSQIDGIDNDVTLQDAYDNGDGTISTTAGKPFELNGSGELVAVTGTFGQVSAVTGTITKTLNVDSLSLLVTHSGSVDFADLMTRDGNTVKSNNPSGNWNFDSVDTLRFPDTTQLERNASNAQSRFDMDSSTVNEIVFDTNVGAAGISSVTFEADTGFNFGFTSNTVTAFTSLTSTDADTFRINANDFEVNGLSSVLVDSSGDIDFAWDDGNDVIFTLRRGANPTQIVWQHSGIFGAGTVEWIWNEGGLGTWDWRMESDTNQRMFFMDASADQIVIGVADNTTNPTHTLSVSGTFAVQDEALFRGDVDVIGDLDVGGTLNAGSIGGEAAPNVFLAYFDEDDFSSGGPDTQEKRDIPLNTEVVKDSNYTHAANSSDVTLGKTGLYEFHCQFTVVSPDAGGGAGGRPQMHLEKDTGGGFSIIDGTKAQGYPREPGSSIENIGTTAGFSWFESIISGDVVKLSVQETETDLPASGTLLASGTRMMIKFLR